MNPARNIYRVGALTACKVLNKYLDGMADSPNRTDEATAGISVAVLNSLNLLKSAEKIITRIIIAMEIGIA